MAYTDIISLSDAKDYLGVDDTSRDVEINRMIGSALRYVEEHSHHILFARSKTYRLSGRDSVRVYDYPINSVTKGIDKDGADVALTFETNYDVAEYRGYIDYYGIDSDAVSLVLNVGYTDPTEIPESLIEAGYMVLEHLYNQKETGNSKLPMAAVELMRTHSRFII